jgi:hypothetical protein
MKAFGTEISEPVTNRFQQIVQMTVTAGAADLVYAIGNLSSQFWTDVNNATYKNLWANISSKGDVIISVSAPAISDPRVLVGSGATLAAGEYKQVTTISGLAISVFTGESVATATITLNILMKPGVLPQEYNSL